MADWFCWASAAKSPCFERSISFASCSTVLPAFFPAETCFHRETGRETAGGKTETRCRNASRAEGGIEAAGGRDAP